MTRGNAEEDGALRKIWNSNIPGKKAEQVGGLSGMRLWKFEF